MHRPAGGGRRRCRPPVRASEVDVVLDRTPFYAEGGGQLADTGVIRQRAAARRRAPSRSLDVQAPVPGLIVHRCRVTAGEITVGDSVPTEIDIERRRAISRSHTATHLVHRAFRGALGESAAQAGSENSPGRFRFDFTATRRGAAGGARRRRGRGQRGPDRRPRRAAYTSIMAEAGRSGALALFGEKYGDAGAGRRGRRLLA